MIFTLKAYNDLGRCSYASLKETFDTEKDIIYLKDKKVEISSIEDLFPFLWTTPGCAYHDNTEHKSVSNFYSTGTHWHHDYDDSITKGKKHIEQLKKKIAKGGVTEKRLAKWKQDIEFEEKHILALQRIQERCDAEMEEQKLKLIEENKGK